MVLFFSKACAKGFKGFIKFIEELFTGTKNGAKADELAEEAKDIEEVIVRGQKPLSLNNIPAYVRQGLQKVGIEIKGRAKDYLLKWKDKRIFKGDWREITDFWKRLKPKLGAGTGGGFKYLSETTSAKIFCQEEPMSCAAACIRQMAKDNKIDIPEKLIREWANTKFDSGTDLENIGMALEKAFKGKNANSGTPYVGLDDMKKTAEVISDVTKKPWLASLKDTSTGNIHTVIVDKIEHGIVHIRDPWDKVKGFGQKNGVEATMLLDDFERYWAGTVYHWAQVKL